MLRTPTAALAAIKHPTWFADWWGNVDWAVARFLGVVFLMSRAISVATLIVAAQLAIRLPLVRPVPHPVWLITRQWDAKAYAEIAAFGYPVWRQGDLPAYFPLFPIVMRAAAWLTGGDVVLAGLLVANVAWFAALWLLYRLAQREFGDSVARLAVIALACFPTAFFSFVPYPEALLLALAIGAFWQMRQGNWRAAALLGMGAALTKQSGLLLTIPYLWEYGAQHGWDVRLLWRGKDWRRAIGQVRRDALWVGLIPAGVAGYMFYLWRAFGDPLKFMHDEASWDRTTMWPWETVGRSILSIPHQATGFLTARIAEEVIITLAVGALIVLGARVMPLSYTFFAVACYLFFLSHPTSGWFMDSQSRYMLEIFPIFLALGVMLARWRWALYPYVALCAPAQVVLLALFARHAWVI